MQASQTRDTRLALMSMSFLNRCEVLLSYITLQQLNFCYRLVLSNQSAKTCHTDMSAWFWHTFIFLHFVNALLSIIAYNWQVIHCGGYLKVRLFGADMAPYEGCCHNSALVSSQLLHDYWGPNHVGPGFREEGKIWNLRCEENEDNTFFHLWTP